MKKFFKKALSVLFGMLWILIIPIYIIAMIAVCLFVDVTIPDCLKFWVLCFITLLSGRGFEEYDITKGDDDDWLFRN